MQADGGDARPNEYDIKISVGLLQYYIPTTVWSNPESFQWFTEEKASRRPIIWLLPHPLSPPVSELDRRPSGRPRKKDNLHAEEAGGEEPNHTTARKSGGPDFFAVV